MRSESTGVSGRAGMCPAPSCYVALAKGFFCCHFCIFSAGEAGQLTSPHGNPTRGSMLIISVSKIQCVYLTSSKPRLRPMY